MVSGIYFNIIKNNNGIYSAIHNKIDYSTQIPNKLMEEAYNKKVSILYENNEFKIKDQETILPDIIDKNFYHNCYYLKPKNLFLPELKWKTVIRNIIKGKNMLFVGFSGSAKTKSAMEAAKALKRPFFKIPMNSTQDPKASLIGNTYFNPESGTYFEEAELLKAIQIENAVILLDEITRADKEANNIIMTVLDATQKYMRVDTPSGPKTIKVAIGVSFIATANIGNEYTGTKKLDRALLDRFSSIVEIDELNQSEEYELLQMTFPNVDKTKLELLTTITESVRNEYINGSISTKMSTRMTMEAAEYLEDDFTLGEVIELTLLPLFDEEGGADSDRQIVKTLLDKYIEKTDEEIDELIKKLDFSNDNPFIIKIIEDLKNHKI